MSDASRITRAVRSGLGEDGAFGAVVPPICLSSTFQFQRFGEPGRYDYTRSGNPTRDALADALAELEGAHGAIVTASGMAAITTVLMRLGPGDRVVAPHDCYGGTYRLLTAWASRGHFELTLADLTREESTREALRPPLSLLWVETPSNPLLRITDLRRVSELAHASGALVAADNTFLSPALQRPLELGADLVVHSTTKYLNGHSDVVGGAVCARTPELLEELRWWANCLGVTGAPFDSFLTLRGLRTLFARWREHQRNTEAVVEALRRSPAVTRVYYPGLPDHPGHDLARRQQDGFGAMVSFELIEHPDAVPRFLKGLRHWFLAESLGGVESLIAHPATMTHAAMGPEARRAAGIGDSMLRLSVGIEEASDLVLDLTDALSRVERLLARPRAGRPSAVT